MRMRLRHFSLCVLLGCISIDAIFSQNTYHSDILANMSESLCLQSRLDSLKDGEYKTKFVYNNKPLRVTKKYGEISHIGYIFFSDKQREHLPIIVCDFWERYILALDLPMKRIKRNEVQLAEDEIVFLKGNINLMTKIIGDTTMNIALENDNDKCYKLSWSKNKNPYCIVRFPIDYNLLHGTSLEENESRLAADLKKTNFGISEPLKVNANQLIHEKDEIYVLSRDYYQIKELNGNLYYVKSKDEKFELVFDNEYPLKSIANLMTTSELSNDFQVQVRLSKYPFDEELFIVPLRQFVGYFLQKGCTPYFGVIGVEDNFAKCLLVMHNSIEGYCHNIDVVADLKRLNNKKGILASVKIHSYIPTSKIKNLFAD